MHEHSVTGNPKDMLSSVASQPPPDLVRVGCWTVAEANELWQLRAELTRLVADQHIPADRALDAVPDKVAMAATELASNALRHGMPPTEVCVHRRTTAFVLDVTDTAVNRLPLPNPDSAAATFGLRIVTTLADHAGWYIDECTKHVWAQFTIPDWQSASS